MRPLLLVFVALAFTLGSATFSQNKKLFLGHPLEVDIVACLADKGFPLEIEVLHGGQVVNWV